MGQKSVTPGLQLSDNYLWKEAVSKFTVREKPDLLKIVTLGGKFIEPHILWEGSGGFGLEQWSPTFRTLWTTSGLPTTSWRPLASGMTESRALVLSISWLCSCVRFILLNWLLCMGGVRGSSDLTSLLTALWPEAASCFSYLQYEKSQTRTQISLAWLNVHPLDQFPQINIRSSGD